MSDPGHILVVCTANICRSPMAEGLLSHALAAQDGPLRSLKVISAGLAARPGEQVSVHSVTALKKVGLDISPHRARPLTQEMLNESLAVFCMTQSHCGLIELQASPVPARMHLLRDFMPEGSTREIVDPYGGSLKHYEQCRDEMVEAIPTVLAYLREITTPPAAPPASAAPANS
jgi:protein-tyrosine-phosphatase